MYEKLSSLINEYNRIIVLRHKNPDGDAYGSQQGLKRLIQINHPNKEVYAVGEQSTYNNFLGRMDIIDDDLFYDALVIIVDVCVSYLIDDDRYKLAKQVVCIDHHLNQPDIECFSIIESNHIACAELVGCIFSKMRYKFDKKASNALLTGIVTDSGRFFYPKTTAETLRMSAMLMENGADLDWIYDQLYVEDINLKKLKGYFINNFQVTKNNVAYMMNSNTVKDMFNVSSFTVSRAMVNQMSRIKDINFWVNFTEEEDGSIMVELRSAKEPVIDIARKYGGGGHALACGCTVNSFEEAKLVLQDLDDLAGGV